jgi:hypothetical protein
LGILAIFKNESRAIREWIEHYLWQGVDTIVMLDNNSTDDWKEEIKDLEDKVIILPAPESHKQNENYFHVGLPRVKAEGVNVLAILDLDEFLFATDGKTLKQHVVELFSKADRPSMVSCQWNMFGSSGFKKQPNSIRKSFIHKKKDKDQDVKSLFWVDDLVDFTGIDPLTPRHTFYKGINMHICKVSGRTDQCPAGLQLNHYRVQSKEFFDSVKSKRGDASTSSQIARNNAYFKEHNHKEETNTTLADMIQ